MASNDENSSAGDTPWTEQDHALVCDRVRSAAHLPGVEIEESHGHLGLAVRGKRFAWLLVDHHGDGRLALTLKAPPGEQDALVGTRPGYFIPSYLGTKGWIGIDLAPSARPDWDEIPALIEQAWRMTASKTAIAAWDRIPNDPMRCLRSAASTVRADLNTDSGVCRLTARAIMRRAPS